LATSLFKYHVVFLSTSVVFSVLCNPAEEFIMKDRLLSSKPAFVLTALLLALVIASSTAFASGGTSIGSLTFSNTPLTVPEGESEPEISIAHTGTMGIVGLQWLFTPTNFGTHLWTGPFGSTPPFRGVVDASLQQSGKQVFGSGDADVDMGSTGTLHITTLIFLFNPTGTSAQLGVSAITCPNASSGAFSISSCTRQIIDTTNSDRPWITSEGTHVYISYHDSRDASLIHVQRSNDDGFTWQKVGDPIVGQDGTTGESTFNNIQGNLEADPSTHNVYDIYASGETGVLKGRTFTPNHIIVSRSTDLGKTWTANLVFQAPAGTSLAQIFPTLAVDPTNGKLSAAWSDGHSVSFSTSSDQGAHWSSAVTVNIAPANTAVFPWLSAYNGTIDLVYYATNTSDTSSAVWNVYLAQTSNGGATFTQSLVSNTPNHVGVICFGGTGCTAGTRNLLDLFQVAIDPLNGKAAIIYTDDTISTTTSSTGSFSCFPGETTCPLPQLVLAQQQ
jgi:hypothetical protein